ncbi:MAG: GNAT family N-acetyltransferase [Candidatus Eisenbacteria bacterium]|uniref:GNAT family N-acetyltransferase n=1 Tax=Eiseniibacteriota bacterium TaxID=2212470 RepID=A0A948W594_UNCEI|nr:GNAT family N-acetyltransferase [Candidatus Eisenbacteria bacterium]MBU1949575.1 GNAT family N-acetyltransferase [Candidatus Eisenbacteria bacterium]MBU2689351.1 GNAT family N-acetyltransferase [Candidatus Eisenbacteria bacterium]
MSKHSFEKLEVSTEAADIGLLRQFYASIYIAEFPDANERESLENMERYISLKADGWYQRNNYHILLYLENGIPVAGSIIDYLAGANVGVIEFLVVSSSLRRSGLGSQLLQWTESVLHRDSISAGHGGWDYIIAEMNDPFKSYERDDSMDGFERALVWDRWGYMKTDFPYVQPSLSADQLPVRNLLLMCKPGRGSDPDAIPAMTLKKAVYGYVIWAMRIYEPDSNQECLAMSRFLTSRTKVGLTSLAAYVAAENSRQLVYTDLAQIPRDEIDCLLDIYESEFGEGPTSFPRELFRKSLLSRRHEGKPYEYHFISIKRRAEGTPHGMASVFAFPDAGFGGYVVLDKVLRGKGHLAEIIALLERCMLMDRRGATGWFGECDEADGSLSIFSKRGFYEVDVTYRQPPLSGRPPYNIADAPVLHLIYKAFGAQYSPPDLMARDFLGAMEWIFRIIYRIDNPSTSDYYEDLRRQIGQRELVPWR